MFKAIVVIKSAFRFKIILFFLVLVDQVYCQNMDSANESQTSIYNIIRTSEKINIDGIMDEVTWSKINATSNFLNQWPLEKGEALIQTKVKITYDSDFIYIGIKTFQKKENITLLSLKRDNVQANWLSDSVIILMDPINNKSNGFLFGINSGGAQYEGLLSVQNGGTSTDVNWDNKWYSATKRYDDFWIAEVAIPFKSLRYDNENTSWGINFVRADMAHNHFSTWSKVPINFDAQDLGYFGILKFDEILEKQTSNISLIPYTTSSYISDETLEDSDKFKLDVGVDAKIAVSSSLNLDLTLNPDFSNVDVDQQVINLTRFDVLFPERRNFFLENSDLFTSFGSDDIVPFFSRRIGLDQNGAPITILGGARLTGNINESLRVGMLDVQTNGENGFLPNNFFVGSFQQRVLARSNIKGLFTNRVSTANDTGQYSYNRTAGLEGEYLSKNGFLSGKGLFHKSFTSSSSSSDDTFLGTQFAYNNGTIFTSFNFYRVGQGYESDLGFVPRLNHFNAETNEVEKIGFWQMNPRFSYVLRPKEKSIFNQQSLGITSFIANGIDRGMMDREYALEYNALLASTGSMSLSLKHITQNLFTPTRLIDGDAFLPIGEYSFNEISASYTSDIRKNFNFSSSITYGSFYTGSKLSIVQGVSYRIAPFANLGITYFFNDVQLGEPYGNEKLHLVIPKFEFSFANNLFWTTFSQYNSQSDSININSRLQWRYSPMCDLFIVYTDNYDGDFNNNNRGIVFKLTYWLSL